LIRETNSNDDDVLGIVSRPEDVHRRRTQSKTTVGWNDQYRGPDANQIVIEESMMIIDSNSSPSAQQRINDVPQFTRLWYHSASSFVVQKIIRVCVSLVPCIQDHYILPR